uniref:Uncharacterized protein n=1 Tax=Anopheles merus TaxID=30066 RepID=A0A182V4C3_ANOME
MACDLCRSCRSCLVTNGLPSLAVNWDRTPQSLSLKPINWTHSSCSNPTKTSDGPVPRNSTSSSSDATESERMPAVSNWGGTTFSESPSIALVVSEKSSPPIMSSSGLKARHAFHRRRNAFRFSGRWFRRLSRRHACLRHRCTTVMLLLLLLLLLSTITTEPFDKWRASRIGLPECDRLLLLLLLRPMPLEVLSSSELLYCDSTDFVVDTDRSAATSSFCCWWCAVVRLLALLLGEALRWSGTAVVLEFDFTTCPLLLLLLSARLLDRWWWCWDEETVAVCATSAAALLCRRALPSFCNRKPPCSASLNASYVLRTFVCSCSYGSRAWLGRPRLYGASECCCPRLPPPDDSHSSHSWPSSSCMVMRWSGLTVSSERTKLFAPSLTPIQMLELRSNEPRRILSVMISICFDVEARLSWPKNWRGVNGACPHSIV